MRGVEASWKSFPCISATLHIDDDDGSSDVNDDDDDDDKANSFSGSIKLVVERSQIRSDANLFVLQI